MSSSINISSDINYKTSVEDVKAKLKKDVLENITSDTLIEFIKNFSLAEVNKRVKKESLLMSAKLGKKIKLVVGEED